MIFASSSYVKAYEDIDVEEFPDMSKVVLDRTSIEMFEVQNKSAFDTVKILNAPDLHDCAFSYSWYNEKVTLLCDVNPDDNTIEIYANGSGSGRVTFTLNGKELYLDVKVTKVKINKKSLLIVKKKKSTLKLKNYPYKVNWMFTKKNVVTISSKGVVKGKKIGNTVAYTKIGNSYVGCAISVINKKMNTVIKAAYKIGKGKYSQPKRMLKGYYDCSSLVWRAYKKAKIKLVNKYYAPVAADLAKHYVKKKKKIKGGRSSKNIKKMKLRPGDLYFCRGAKNGRYKGIYHVEMFTGYVCEQIYDHSGEIVLAPKWATVPDGYYYDSSIMVRPYKQK